MYSRLLKKLKKPKLLHNHHRLLQPQKMPAKDDFVFLKGSLLRKIIVFSASRSALAGISFSLLALLSSVSFMPTAHANTQIGRYSTVANKPTAAQVNPLLAVAQYKFSSQVETIGDAVKVVLQNTSYQLAPQADLPVSVTATLKKPLPITVRTLGPMPIKDALVVLLGKDVFNLVVDPLHRLVNFEVKPKIKKALSISEQSAQKEVNNYA